MLGEGFLRTLPFRVEKQNARTTGAYTHTTATHTHSNSCFNGTMLDANPLTLSAGTGLWLELPGLTQSLGLTVKPQAATALFIPPCLTVAPPSSQPSISWDSSSLLQQYPDLRLGLNRGMHDASNSPEGYPDPGHGVLLQASGCPLHLHEPENLESQGDRAVAETDQGYLAMGDSVVQSLELPGAGREPLSNSLLNGMLEKQLDEVYLQHLTDSLAHCSSVPGCSLLQGLVPPPQPDRQPQGPDSLAVALQGEERGQQSSVISYMSAHDTNFSSPVLRISDTGHTHTPAPAP
ncbi:uncharacterized protein si:dkey-237j10.2 [Osmerus eperlanus]|uniref:uncharacterized protein si:dkey-237j10.2 n=1 Tax=Osmerus eperlanus TaxID=29151 RepID=UPI002E1400C7